MDKLYGIDLKYSGNSLSLIIAGKRKLSFVAGRVKFYKMAFYRANLPREQKRRRAFTGGVLLEI